LSPDYVDGFQYESQLTEFLKLWQNGNLEIESTNPYPSIKFGIETALLDLETGGIQRLYDTPFTQSKEKIRINGLIWMGSPEDMRHQIREKINHGFSCIKLKIGAISWFEELT